VILAKHPGKVLPSIPHAHEWRRILAEGASLPGIARRVWTPRRELAAMMTAIDFTEIPRLPFSAARSGYQSLLSNGSNSCVLTPHGVRATWRSNNP
jgi:hypothetical protein